MVILKIIIVIMFFIGLLGVLVVICTGKLKTEEEIINDIEEEARYWKDYNKQKKQKKKSRIFKNNLHIL